MNIIFRRNAVYYIITFFVIILSFFAVLFFQGKTTKAHFIEGGHDGFNPYNFTSIDGTEVASNFSLLTSSTESTIGVAWNASIDNSVLGYEIQYCGGEDCTPSNSFSVMGKEKTSTIIEDLESNTVYKVRIREIIDSGSWWKVDRYERAVNVQDGFVDNIDNRMFVVDSAIGVYYASLDESGFLLGEWLLAGRPSVQTSQLVDVFVDSINRKLWVIDRENGAYYKELDERGAPKGSWSSEGDNYGDGKSINGGFVDVKNNILWMFGWEGNAYYKKLDESGAPRGEWAVVETPSISGENSQGVDLNIVFGGFVDIENNRIWMFDVLNGIYYKDLDDNGMPFGEWGIIETQGEANFSANGFIDNINRKFWLFDNDRNAVYYKFLDEQGLPVGNWADEDTISSIQRNEMSSGFIDTYNNRVWLSTYEGDLYYKTLIEGFWFAEGEITTESKGIGYFFNQYLIYIVLFVSVSIIYLIKFLVIDKYKKMNQDL